MRFALAIALPVVASISAGVSWSQSRHDRIFLRDPPAPHAVAVLFDPPSPSTPDNAPIGTGQGADERRLDKL